MSVFKNKALQVTMVPKHDGSTETAQVEISAETIEKIGETAKDVMEHAASIMFLYIIADTARKVVIEVVKK